MPLRRELDAELVVQAVGRPEQAAHAAAARHDDVVRVDRSPCHSSVSSPRIV